MQLEPGEVTSPTEAPVDLIKRAPSTLRTLETLQKDHSDFLNKGGGDLKVAKRFNNVIGTPFFPIPLDQVRNTDTDAYNVDNWYNTQVCLPGLHISLGIFYKLFTLFEEKVHQLDMLIAHTQSTAAPDVLAVSRAFQTHTDTLREINRLFEEANELDDEADSYDDLATWVALDGEDERTSKKYQKKS